jgi:hypothetical protein
MRVSAIVIGALLFATLVLAGDGQTALQPTQGGDATKGQTVMTPSGQQNTECTQPSCQKTQQAAAQPAAAQPAQNEKPKKIAKVEKAPSQVSQCDCCGKPTCGCGCPKKEEHVAPEIREEPKCDCCGQPKCGCPCAAKKSSLIETTAAPSEQGQTVLKPGQGGDATKGQTVMTNSASNAQPAQNNNAQAQNNTSNDKKEKDKKFVKVESTSSPCDCCGKPKCGCPCQKEEHVAPEIREEPKCNCCGQSACGCCPKKVEHVEPELRDNFVKPCTRADGCSSTIDLKDDKKDDKKKADTKSSSLLEVSCPCATVAPEMRKEPCGCAAETKKTVTVETTGNCGCCGQDTCTCCPKKVETTSCDCCGKPQCGCGCPQWVAPEIRSDPPCCCKQQVTGCRVHESCGCAVAGTTVLKSGGAGSQTGTTVMTKSF